jgi:hypothetical protein
LDLRGYLAEVPPLVDAFKIVFVVIGEPQLGTGHQVPDGARDKDLTRCCGSKDPGGDVHCQPSDVAMALLDLAGVDARIDLKTEA